MINVPQYQLLRNLVIMKCPYRCPSSQSKSAPCQVAHNTLFLNFSSEMLDLYIFTHERASSKVHWHLSKKRNNQTIAEESELKFKAISISR